MAGNGQIGTVDVWKDVPEERRNGRLRYDNMLHVPLPSRVIRSTTNPVNWSPTRSWAADPPQWPA